MNLFDKLCAALAFLLGVVFVLLGIMGIFTGCNANFTLPPILGGLPLLVGWGIVRSVTKAWNLPSAKEVPPRQPGAPPPPHGYRGFDRY